MVSPSKKQRQDESRKEAKNAAIKKRRAKAKQQPTHDAPPATPPLSLRHGASPRPQPLTLSRVERAPAHSDCCLQVGASGCPRRFARRLICGRIVVGFVCQVLSHCICNLVYEICALLCFSCRGSILQPGAEGGWQQRGLCICAMYLCQNERSDKSSDRELALFQIYKRNTHTFLLCPFCPCLRLQFVGIL